MIDVINDLASLPKLNFYKTQAKESGKSSFKVTLGVMPDYSFQGKGLRIDAVNKDKPAEKAGLKDGDIVIQLGEIKVENIYDYMGALGKFTKGQTTLVIVKRGEEIVRTEVTF
jgi:S1-C subfamily serine protease